MSKYAEDIFREPAVLRKKLDLYLKTPQKTMLYARVAEKFFYSSGKRYVKFQITWSWWAFFFTFWFFIYRKSYIAALIIFILTCISGSVSSLATDPIADGIIGFFINFFIMIFSAIFAKFLVIKQFEKELMFEDDNVLRYNGGANRWVVWLILIGWILIIVLGILAAFAIPRLTATSEDAEYSRAKTNIVTVMTDLSSYYISQGNLPVFLKDATSVDIDVDGVLKVDGDRCLKFEVGYYNTDIIIKNMGSNNEICRKIQKEYGNRKFSLTGGY